MNKEDFRALFDLFKIAKQYKYDLEGQNQFLKLPGGREHKFVRHLEVVINKARFVLTKILNEKEIRDRYE